ncbi:sulfite oxidase [Natrinema salifodinae]|uniref:Mo-co oxidoreductase dimerisation domain-containing protein n=1 Tax=Natrinema salifodinae TaxID=1202768 RepID=A0A1I0Q555_9EURY|nr:sulfite oxidase [Natrinema salifodinae]SEW22062.1 Mo-co oxidoreductase dimerisation domain-containing protein [Natrinema salifodinae]
MSDSERSENRERELAAILERKPGTEAIPDFEDRYRVVGAADRSTYANWLTPVEDHYVCHRNETLDPEIDDWTVELTGAVDRDADLDMKTIREDYPAVAVAHTMECAGNGRGYFEPETGNVQWEYGAVSTAFWTGAPLSSVLADHGAATDDGTWLTAVGGDHPEVDAENDRFARSVPMSKVLDDCILAYEVNGEPLPPEHGRPVRLLVPGWYGVNSVKWLSELHVTEKMVHGPEWEDRDGADYTKWQQSSYRIHPEGVEPESRETVSTYDTWEQQASDEVDHPYTFDENVKSTIGYPDDGATVSPRGDGTIEVVGVAWAGDDQVTEIEVSTDGGDGWDEGSFFGPNYDCAWRLFRYVWEPSPGSYTLVSRATDEHGRRQPARISRPDADEAETEDGEGGADDSDDEYPWNEGGYAENAYAPHAVEVTVDRE